MPKSSRLSVAFCVSLKYVRFQIKFMGVFTQVTYGFSPSLCKLRPFGLGQIAREVTAPEIIRPSSKEKQEKP
jgi:hypothetical protein